jgi:hypothetical protein
MFDDVGDGNIMIKQQYRHEKMSPEIMEDRLAFSCDICAKKDASIKIEATTSGYAWWWQDSVCSEECLNLWLLQRL